MHSKVHPLVVLLVLLLTATAAALWVWGTGAARAIGGPAELKTGPDGHLYIQIQNQLLEHDAAGLFVARHDLADLGVELMLGSFDFFSNGDVLLRRGPDPRGFLDNLRAFQRRSNENSLVPDSPETGMYRCDLPTKTCSQFGANAVDFKAAHSVLVDRRTDEVFVADTTRHVLRKYSADGEPVAGPVGGFKFPNQLLLHDDQLMVVNTNFHQIRVVDAATASFGDEIQVINVVPADAERAGQSWPSHATRVNEKWWVNNMRTAMNEGGIYVFDAGWRYERRVELPPGADPVALLAFGSDVLISDWNNDLVHRVSPRGVVLGHFESPGLEQVLGESRLKRRQFAMYGYAGIVLFALTIVGLLVRALAVSMSAPPAQAKSPERVQRGRDSDELVWYTPDPKTIRKARLAMRLAGYLIIALGVLLSLIVFFSGQVQIGLRLVLPMTGFVVIFALIERLHRANAGTAIGLQGDRLLLRDHTGRESGSRIKDIRYSQTVIATSDMAVFLGQPQMSLYDRQWVKDVLLPRLAPARQLSPWQMQRELARLRHPQGTLVILTILGFMAVAAWFFLRELAV